MRHALAYILSCGLVLSQSAGAGLHGLHIGIDPGHGGGDPGAIANGLNEKDLNLATALYLKQFMEADGAIVTLSRRGDESLTSAVSGTTELSTRARFFNSRGVDYVVSVHHNAFPSNPAANGVLSYIMRGNCEANSGKFAGKAVARLLTSTGLRAMGGANGPGCTGKPGVFQWNATIVTDTNMPAILTESSFMTHPTEAEKLRNPEYLRQNAWAIYAGFVDHLGRKALPYAATLEPPVLQYPADATQGLSPFGVEFSWLNRNTPQQLQQVRFSLQETPEYRLPGGDFIGPCQNLALAVDSGFLPSADCGPLRPAQWYRWEVEVELTNGHKTKTAAYFKTGAVTVTLDGQPVTALAFGDQASASHSLRRLLLSNPAQAAWKPQLQLEQEGAAFSYQHNCPPSLNLGQSCEVELSFNPAQPGPNSGVLKLFHAAEQGDALLGTLPLSGSGLAATEPPPAAPAVTPPPLDFSLSLLTKPLSLRLHAEPVVAGGVYTWRSSEGHSADGPSAEFQFRQPGHYQISLQLDSGGTRLNQSKTVQMRAEPLLCVGLHCTVGNGDPAGCNAALLETALGQANRVDFNCGPAPHTIRLNRELNVTRPLSLHGGGIGQGGLISLDGGNQTRIIRLAEGVELSLRNLTLQRGRGQGDSGAGGALFAEGANRVSLVNCRFDANDGTAGLWEGGGGAVQVKGFSQVRVENSLFSNNRGLNGAALNTLLSEVTLLNSSFIGNDARPGAARNGGLGGAVYIDGAGDNLDPGGGQVLIQGCTFRDNHGSGQGGALFSFVYPPDRVDIIDTHFAANSVSRNDLNQAAGGAVWHGNGELSLERSSFHNNLAQEQGGALWLDGTAPARLVNLTFAANRAVSDPDSGHGGIGGAITGLGHFSCQHCTFANNHAGYAGGAIYGNLNVGLRNSLLAYNSAGNNDDRSGVYQTCAGQMRDDGGNLQFPSRNPASNLDTDCVGRFIAADPQLGALGHYGGATPSLALAATSPALDALDPATCAATDQRGVPRPQAATKIGGAPRCDIGAVEYTGQAGRNNGLGYDSRSGQPVASNAHFVPQLRSDSGTVGNPLQLTQQDGFSIAVRVLPDPAHLGQPATLVVAALMAPAYSEIPFWIMRQGSAWLPWDGDVTHLGAAETRSALREEEDLSIFRGQFSGLPGDFSVHVGYRLESGLFVFNAGDPLRFSVK